ncbi:hypothetical protein TNCV_3499461 [Trichonephila clavipes]|nr:hypothetical protein TNCV_3499461 [Trichonephila clavipes]
MCVVEHYPAGKGIIPERRGLSPDTSQHQHVVEPPYQAEAIYKGSTCILNGALAMKPRCCMDIKVKFGIFQSCIEIELFRLGVHGQNFGREDELKIPFRSNNQEPVGRIGTDLLLGPAISSHSQ